MIKTWWNERVLPRLIERVCGSKDAATRRAAVVAKARGRVLEVGIGSGLNLPFYDASAIVDLVAVEPSPALLAIARERSQNLGFPVTIFDATAEALPFADASFDSIVITYSLCSLADRTQALAEMHRVLRPGGALHFIEHGLAPDADVVRWQRWLTPAWRQLAGGCRLDNDVARVLARAGFTLADVERGYGRGARWFTYLHWGSATAVGRRPIDSAPPSA